MARSKGFFQLLFDFSFSEFIALRLVGFLYGLAIFFAGLGSLSILLAGFRAGIAQGLGALILAPLLFLFNVILARIILETLVVAFRTAKNTGRTAENTEYLRNS
ncbi:DUF4282 domain-containing protein [Romeria aff. gracilis LEGE 07310]|uniref:DUF4282 domain-containing protein n=1 Tax=Vasconcelosia minhoensis LEGE 07310 TaxID=915328 RepID=A0A8J7AH31_9CYAN|nr:DUF4282 domain-containing protein [Romeria gracilis]MBE9077428.1 DUF4282 domain-containing protein [Romeria aff. gracilis LEGE 07310]